MGGLSMSLDPSPSEKRPSSAVPYAASNVWKAMASWSRPEAAGCRWPGGGAPLLITDRRASAGATQTKWLGGNDVGKAREVHRGGLRTRCKRKTSRMATMNVEILNALEKVKSG